MESFHDQGNVEGQAGSVSNLADLLVTAAETSPSAGLTIYPHGGTAQPPLQLTYPGLLNRAKRGAEALHSINGIHATSIILLPFDNHLDSIVWFWAVTFAGYLPAISSPFVNDIEGRTKHILHLQQLLDGPIILTTRRLEPEFLGLDGLKISHVETLQSPVDSQNPLDAWSLLKSATVANSDQRQSMGTFVGHSKKSEDTAVLMLTSGSSGKAKAVCLRHEQILAAVRGKSEFHGTKSKDPFLNWINMDHVANLTEIHLHVMFLGADQIHRSIGELSPAESVDQSINLSALRAIISGGEPTVVDTCVTLTRLLRQYQLEGEVIRPGFGMTETCAGVTCSRSFPSQDLRNDQQFANHGLSIPGSEMRVINAAGDVAVPCEEGILQFRGPVIFSGYFNNIVATRDAFSADNWFVTGDKASLDQNGNLNMLGREQEVININGNEFFPHEIEYALEARSIKGVTPSFIVVFPTRPKELHTEHICVVYLPTFGPEDSAERVETSNEINESIFKLCRIRPHRIVPLDQAFLCKTSLGKLSRNKIRKAFEAGQYDVCQSLNEKAIAAYEATKEPAQP